MRKLNGMTLFNLILVALVQGVTEFLPVSSSGHLILLPSLTGMNDQGQVIDVAVHVGSLVAVVMYFWTDVRMALHGLKRLAVGKVDTDGAILAFCRTDRVDHADFWCGSVLGRQNRTKC